MRVAVPKESKTAEGRVALTPHAVRELTRAGLDVLVERGAGVASGFSDEAYAQAGAELASETERLWREAELIVKVKEPNLTEAGWLSPGQRLFCYLHLAAEPELARALCRLGATAIAFETVTDATGGLPLLAPMSAIAGRLAGQIGSNLLFRQHGGQGLLLGGVPGTPRGRAVVLGVGVAGGHALQVLAALGAEVVAFDRNPQRLEQAQAMGANVSARYAHHESIAEAVAAADIVIGAVLVPGARAPIVVERAQIEAMRGGSVVVDIAVDQGGCIETTRPTSYAAPTYVVADVVHFAVTNMPGAVPRTATEALSGRIAPYVLRLAAADWRKAADLGAGVNVEAGSVVHPAVAHALAEAQRGG